MAYEATSSLRVGEKDLIFGQDSVASGTISMTAGALFTLYNSAGQVVAGFNGIAVTGQNNGPALLVNCWLLLDTTSTGPGGALAAGIYYGVFTYTATPSADSIGRVSRPDVQIILLAVAEISGLPYDPTTILGQTRFQVADTDASQYVWSDAEVNVALGLYANNTFLAGAFLINSAISDRAKRTALLKIGSFTRDAAELPKALQAQADRLISLAPIAPIVLSPDQDFTPANSALGIIANMGGNNW
jgi:hypothetical protein